MTSETMVDLAELARLHQEATHPDRLDDVFGDGALLARLKPLARLRQRVRAFGYRFVSLDTLPGIYTILPLVLLPEILEQRTIPYRANARTMIDFAAGATGPIFDEVTFEDTSPLCLVHHESAHALFFEIVRKAEGEGLRAKGNAPGSKGARRLVEVLVESEGFALGLDIFVAIQAFVDPRRATNQLRSINSPPHQLALYDRGHPGMMTRLATLVAAHPFHALKTLATGAYVANLRPRATNQVSEAFAERVLGFVGMPAGFEVEGRELLSIGMTIDFAFRQRLAPTLFRYLGIEREFEAVLGTALDQALAPGGSFDAHLSETIAQLGLVEPFALPG